MISIKLLWHKKIFGLVEESGILGRYGYAMTFDNIII